MKLFFDDVRNAPAGDWITVRDVPAAKTALSTMTFDVISLDHDIGYQMLCPLCSDELNLKPSRSSEPGFLAAFAVDVSIEDTLKRGCIHCEDGTTLACWMVENLTTWPETVIIHSANWYAAERMKGILEGNTKIVVMPYTELHKIC